MLMRIRMRMLMGVVIFMALAQIPISTFSHIWVFVCQYGIMFVIIVIIIIIIITVSSVMMAKAGRTVAVRDVLSIVLMPAS